jgi:hypothetical protein
VTADSPSPAESTSLLARFGRFTRRVLLLCALFGAVAAAAYYYVRHRADEEIRAFVEARLTEQFAPKGLAVSLGYARLVEGRGIQLGDVAVLDPAAEAPHVELVRVDEIFIYSKVTLHDLLRSPPDAQHVAVHGLRLNAARQLDGAWNVARLFPLPRCGGKTPTVSIDNAVVLVNGAPSSTATSLNLREIDLKLTPLDDSADAADTAGAGGAADPACTRMRVVGHLAGDHFGKVHVEGICDAEQGTWSLRGSIDDLKLSPELYSAIPQELAGYLEPIKTLEGRAALNFDVVRTQPGAPPAFAVEGRLSQASFRHVKLPYPLTEIEARVYADNGQWKVEACKARCGAAIVELHAHQQGLGEGSPLRLTLSADQLLLEPRLSAALPAQLLDVWSSFDPEGPVDVDLALSYDGRNWTPDLTIDSRGASFAYSGYRYRIHDCAGRVQLKDDVCTIDVTGAAAGRPVRFAGTIRHPGENYTGEIEVTLDGAVPIDEVLLSALDPAAQRVVRSLNPRGMITFHGRFGRQDPQTAQIESSFDIGLLDCAMRYDKFAYPIDHIRGRLHYENGDWTFRDLEGHNDSGYIVCNGSWRGGGAGQGSLLKLNFVGTDIPLEDELRDAMSGEAQRVWAGLRPRGAVDHVNVELAYTTADKHLSLDVTAQKWKRKSDADGRAMSIDPTWFPYAIDVVSGAARFRDGAVELQDVVGAHGKTTFTLSGACQFADDGRWRVKFERLAADRIACDHALTSALPGGLGDAVRRLHIDGPIGMLGTLELWGDAQSGRMPAAAWDLSFDIENGSLNAGMPLEHIHGGTRLIGEYGAGGLQCRGSLAVDSVIFHDAQMTQVIGPLWIDQSRVLFGAWTSRASGVEAPPVKAQVFGGALEGDAELSLSGDGQFVLHAALSDGELTRLSQDLTSRRDTLSGKAFALVDLTGNSRGTHTWRGNGLVRLRSADIYELPVMLALLKVLSLQRPDKTAFNSADIDFRIEGDHLQFERINFSGDTLTLKGTGWMNLDRQIDIDFYTMVGKDRIRIPIITPALGMMSRELLLIHAGGTLDEPQLERKSFPGLNERLKQLFPEMERREAGPPPPPGIAEFPDAFPRR